jgi:hypothetical protein
MHSQQKARLPSFVFHFNKNSELLEDTQRFPRIEY